MKAEETVRRLLELKSKESELKKEKEKLQKHLLALYNVSKPEDGAEFKLSREFDDCKVSIFTRPNTSWNKKYLEDILTPGQMSKAKKTSVSLSIRPTKK